jgi:hypothetical protein
MLQCGLGLTVAREVGQTRIPRELVMLKIDRFMILNG